MENLFATKYDNDIVGIIGGFDRQLFYGQIIQLTFPQVTDSRYSVVVQGGGSLAQRLRRIRN